MSVTISPPMFLQFMDPNNSGAPLVGGKLFTYIAGTSTKQATWTDSTQLTQNDNPIILDSNGAANVWLNPTLTYKFVLSPSNDTDPPASPLRTVDNIQGFITLALLTQVLIGSILYPRTSIETAVSVAPVNFFYPPGVIDRYGTNTTPGTTDMSAAFAAALAQQQGVTGQGGSPMQLLAATYLVTTNAIKTQSNQKPVVIFGVPFRSCIVNTAPANTPTIQLIDQFTFEISGIVFAGRATFPNTAIDLTSASGGQRTGFGKIIDCVLLPNGIGIHIAGLNDLVIDSCKYWPNGAGGFPGAGTNDGANALPGAIWSDTNGVGGWNPGEVNHVFIRDLQIGSCNLVSATPPGSGILVDGSLNGSSTAINANHASTEWHIDGYDSGSCQRALYTRFCQFFTVENMYSISVRVDNGCTGMMFRSIYSAAFTVDGTQALGGNTRLTYISCTGTITADAANIESVHINNNWTTETDLSAPKQVLSGVANGARSRAIIGGDGLSMGPAGAIQLAGTSGAGLTIQTASQTVVRINPNGACTAGILALPTTQTDGAVVKVLNLSGATFTMAAAGTSHVADGVSCVIPAQRQMDFTFEISGNLWYHSG